MFPRYIPLSQSDFVLSALVHALRKPAWRLLHTCYHGVKASEANYEKLLKIAGGVLSCVSAYSTKRGFCHAPTLPTSQIYAYTHARTVHSTDSQHSEQRHASVPCLKNLMFNSNGDISFPRDTVILSLG